MARSARPNGILIIACTLAGALRCFCTCNLINVTHTHTHTHTEYTKRNTHAIHTVTHKNAGAMPRALRHSESALNSCAAVNSVRKTTARHRAENIYAMEITQRVHEASAPVKTVRTIETRCSRLIESRAKVRVKSTTCICTQVSAYTWPTFGKWCADSPTQTACIEHGTLLDLPPPLYRRACCERIVNHRVHQRISVSIYSVRWSYCAYHIRHSRRA